MMYPMVILKIIQCFAKSASETMAHVFLIVTGLMNASVPSDIFSTQKLFHASLDLLNVRARCVTTEESALKMLIAMHFHAFVTVRVLTLYRLVSGVDQYVNFGHRLLGKGTRTLCPLSVGGMWCY